MGFVKDLLHTPVMIIETCIKLAALVYFLILGLALTALVWYMIYLALQVI